MRTKTSARRDGPRPTASVRTRISPATFRAARRPRKIEIGSLGHSSPPPFPPRPAPARRADAESRASPPWLVPRLALPPPRAPIRGERHATVPAGAARHDVGFPRTATRSRASSTRAEPPATVSLNGACDPCTRSSRTAPTTARGWRAHCGPPANAPLRPPRVAGAGRRARPVAPRGPGRRLENDHVLVAERTSGGVPAGMRRDRPRSSPGPPLQLHLAVHPPEHEAPAPASAWRSS